MTQLVLLIAGLILSLSACAGPKAQKEFKAPAPKGAAVSGHCLKMNDAVLQGLIERFSTQIRFAENAKTIAVAALVLSQEVPANCLDPLNSPQ